MSPILHPLLALLASVTRQELARQVAWLKEENRILRSRLPERLVATPQERRRLLRVGRRLGVQLKELISIVSYQTFRRWIREKEAAHTAKQIAPRRKPGRPRTPDDIRELVLKLAREKFLGLRPDPWRTSETGNQEHLPANREGNVECMDKFVIVAERHLNYVCKIWSRHYNEERPHSAREHLPPDFTVAPAEAKTIHVNDIVCTSRLGGVINSYSRRAA